jgi:two-component system, LuxR family, response regulator FixJ
MTRGTVFVVDDDAAVARSVARLVRVLGFEARTFDSAGSFLAGYAGERGCLLVDIRMPGMSGIELLEELARRGESLPAIVMSGHAEGSGFLRPGVRTLGVLEKPFPVDSLRHLLARWQPGPSAGRDVRDRA